MSLNIYLKKETLNAYCIKEQKIKEQIVFRSMHSGKITIEEYSFISISTKQNFQKIVTIYGGNEGTGCYILECTIR